jgi:hypothetical protein
MGSRAKNVRQSRVQRSAGGARLIRSPLFKWVEGIGTGQPLTDPNELDWFDERGWADFDRVVTPADNPLVTFTERLYKCLANIEAILREYEMSSKRYKLQIFLRAIRSRIGRNWMHARSEEGSRGRPLSVVRASNPRRGRGCSLLR